MAAAANRKSIMTLYSSTLCVFCHRARIVLKEKGISADIEYIDVNDPPDDFIELNPYGTTPTMIDRNLVLYNSRIIMEYLDERFPHPPLYPMDPVSRAQARMLIHRIEQDWYSHLAAMESGSKAEIEKHKKVLRENLIAAAPLFDVKPYFMGEEFSLVDCSLAPLLWRLKGLEIEFPKQARGIEAYAEKIFSRRSFQSCLSDQERDLVEMPAKH